VYLYYSYFVWVAEKSSVCLFGGRFSIILFIVASNPKSKHRSASSSTKTWKKEKEKKKMFL
jgi:hypothetical protein